MCGATGGDKGPHTMMEDEHTLKGIVCEKYPDLPYFLFGHSMGSFITRDFIAKYGDELAGATICGTTGIFRGAEETGKKLKEAIDAGHGEESDPSYTGELMGWMCERCGEVSIGNEWICADPYVQRDHADDPFDAFTRPTSNRSVYDFIQMMLQIEGTKWAEKVPTDMAIYNIAGDQDPVGEYGVGVYQVSNWLVQTGHNVTTKLYSDTVTRYIIMLRLRTKSKRVLLHSWTRHYKNVLGVGKDYNSKNIEIKT